MSKLTFRADDELVARLEALDASKSEVIRDALRRYLDEGIDRSPPKSTEIDLQNALDGAIDERVSQLIDRNRNTVTITLGVSTPPEPPRNGHNSSDHSNGRPTRCHACGEPSVSDHPFCPQCGTDRGGSCAGCGLRLRDEWAFCPDCGRRAPPPDVIDGA